MGTDVPFQSGTIANFIVYQDRIDTDLLNLCAHSEESRRTIYSYLDFGLKNSSFRLPYQRPSSSTDCARELFNGSNESASLVDCTRKKFFG